VAGSGGWRGAHFSPALITANSVAKEWVLDEIAAARNLRVPIIPAFLEDVRLPDELQFMLQRQRRGQGAAFRSCRPYAGGVCPAATEA
jgi:hypothetical protein